VVLAILQLLQGKVLGLDDAIPARLQAEPFGDSALGQVAYEPTKIEGWQSLFVVGMGLFLQIILLKSCLESCQDRCSVLDINI
jgi:hypothetical protein